MVWIVAKRVRTKKGHRLYKKKSFKTWQEARIYQQDMFEKGVLLMLLEERND